jgi:hypothetical protein
LKSQGKRGRKRPADAECVIKQAMEVFAQKRREFGNSAKLAAKDLGISLASFYNYVNGKTVPDMDVLKKASEKWGTKWKYIDTSEILPKLKIREPEQFVFSFLDALRESDVEIVRIGPKGHKTLQVTLNIRFTA